MFFKKKNVKDQAKKFDKLITGLIIGGAVASIIGISKTTKGKEITENAKKSSTNFFQKGYSVFGKILVGGLKIFTKNK